MQRAIRILPTSFFSPCFLRMSITLITHHLVHVADDDGTVLVSYVIARYVVYLHLPADKSLKTKLGSL